MSDIERRLLLDVIENRHDDLPRLVYADWLEERGDPRGEFIRVQCELAQTDSYDPRRTELESRELQLIRQYSKGWARPFRRFCKRWWFRKGFVEDVELSCENFQKRRTDIFQNSPIRGVRLNYIGARVMDLQACPELTKIERIGLRKCDWGWGEQRAPRFETAMQAIKAMSPSSLSIDRLGNAEAQRLAEAPCLDGIKTLELHESALSDWVVESFVASQRIKGLRSLHFGSVLPAPFAVSQMIERLHTLSLLNVRLNLPWQDVLWSPQKGSLRHLSLNNVHAGDSEDSAASIFSSPLFGGLESLTLRQIPLNQHASLWELVGQPKFATVRQFSLSNSLNPYGGIALAESPYVTNLTHLEMRGVGGRQIFDEGFSMLINSPNLARLASLTLPGNSLTSRSVRELMNSRRLEPLYCLDLSHNGIDDAGARLLAARGPWSRLALLNLRHNHLSKPAQQSLRRKFGCRILY